LIKLGYIEKKEQKSGEREWNGSIPQFFFFFLKKKGREWNNFEFYIGLLTIKKLFLKKIIPLLKEGIN